MNQSINQLINDEAVYRTAPAKPGLLNMSTQNGQQFKCVFCVSFLMHLYFLRQAYYAETKQGVILVPVQIKVQQFVK